VGIKKLLKTKRYMVLPNSTLLFSCTLMLVSPAWSQDEDESEDEYEAVMEEVHITGSHIKRSNLDSPSPVLIFDAAQLLDTGITTLGEFARYLPQNAETMGDSQSGGSPFQGSSSFNLRGIGLDATLTLVNGRRIAPFGSSGDASPFVDINSIPVAAIERIEVLKDGASAIYGSEAVAGVVNIITRKKIEGVTVEGGYMTTTEGDGDEWDVNISGGWNNSLTRLTGTLSYFSRDVIYNRDREWSSDLDFRDRGGPNRRSTLSSPPNARLQESGGGMADPACPIQSDLNSLDIIVPGVLELCRFNWAHFVTLQQPSDRFGLTASLEHAFRPGLTLFAEFLYTRNKTESVGAPTPIQRIFVPGYHPDNPFGENVLLDMRTLDTGDRGFKTTVTTWRALVGLRGDVSGWDWETALMASESMSDDSRVNSVLAQEFGDALLGLGGPNGDQFYNPFGLDTQNDQEVIDQFLISGTGTQLTTKELTLDLQITGNFGNLPGGPVGSAFGFQARSQKLKQRVDEEELSGAILGGGGLSPIDADRDIYSVFAEFMLPLHRTLEAQLAIRYDHYSDFGSTTNPKIGLGWRPLEEILLRATWGTSFRPPTFRELKDPAVSFFSFYNEDPHRCPATGDFFDCFGDVVEGEFKGNPELTPDEGETLSFGLVWEPEFAEGLTLTVDFWQIKHKNRILKSDNSFLSPLLLERLDPYTNPFFVRESQTAEDIALGIPGKIIKTTDTFINGDTLDTNGIDFGVNYNWDAGRAGFFNASLNYSYMNEYVFGTDFMGIAFEEDWAGWYGFTGGLPQSRGNLRLGWSKNEHGASALIAYVGRYESFRTLYVDGVNTGEPFIIDDYAQLDLQYSYIFESLKGGMLRLGCRNCTDADPPVYNQSVNTETFHEGRGAMVYVRWSQPF
jgi:iron complex outermembrane receptor protein